jgi:hypothetical protein
VDHGEETGNQTKGDHPGSQHPNRDGPPKIAR